MTSPNSGEFWRQESTYTIKWDKVGGANYVKIELYKADELSITIEADTKNDGSYSWEIPSTVLVGSDYKIRVQSIKPDSSQSDLSDDDFSVRKHRAKLSSPAFNNTQTIPKKYTCDGSDSSPPLTISGIPSGAKELVLFLDDLDGTPSATNTTTDWNHWVVTNIGVKGGAKGTFKKYRIPTGAKEGLNDSGDSKYEPICPPGEKGDREKHNYQFTLYAIDKKINNNSSTRAQVVTAIDGAILEKKTLKGYFGD